MEKIKDLATGKSKEELRELLTALQQKIAEADVDFPHVSDKGAVEPRVENTLALLRHYDIGVRYNEMTKDVEIDIPDKDFHPDTKRNTQLIEIIDRARHHGIRYKTDIDEHIQLIAQDNAFHPARDWILEKPWDGTSRLPDLLNTITSDTPVKDLVLRRWLISCVAALFEPNGVKSEGLVVLSGRQGSGKTTWVKNLVPGKDWVLDGAMLNPSDKDSVLNCVTHWIVELGELGSTFRKSDVDALKAFITRQRDDIRPPYARKIDSYARRTVFFGTVDIDDFLVDTENRRFWTLQIDEVDAFHGLDLQQLWAEIHELYRAGERWYLDREEQRLLEASNKYFDALTPVKEVLTERVSDPQKTGSESNQYIGIRDLLIQLGIHNPTKADMNEGAQFLTREGYRRQSDTKRFWVSIDATTASLPRERRKADSNNVINLLS